jgi:hypothetical protein
VRDLSEFEWKGEGKRKILEKSSTSEDISERCKKKKV